MVQVIKLKGVVVNSEREIWEICLEFNLVEFIFCDLQVVFSASERLSCRGLAFIRNIKAELLTVNC